MKYGIASAADPQCTGRLDVRALTELLTSAAPGPASGLWGPEDDKVGQMKAARIARADAARRAEAAAKANARKPLFLKQAEDERLAADYVAKLEREQRHMQALVHAKGRDPNLGVLMPLDVAKEQLRAVQSKLDIAKSQHHSLSRGDLVESQLALAPT